MGHRLFPVVKEGVRGPNLTRHQVVEGQNIHWSVEFQPLILPALPEENIYGVLLRTDEINSLIDPTRLLLSLMIQFALIIKIKTHSSSLKNAKQFILHCSYL